MIEFSLDLDNLNYIKEADIKESFEPIIGERCKSLSMNLLSFDVIDVRLDPNVVTPVRLFLLVKSVYDDSEQPFYEIFNVSMIGYHIDKVNYVVLGSVSENNVRKALDKKSRIKLMLVE